MNDSQQLETLTKLGLNRYEASAYLSLLERQDFTPVQIASRAKIPRQRIYDVLARLSDRGLCVERHSGKERLFQAVDPARALPTLLQAKQRQYEQELAQQQQHTDAMITALGPLYAAGHNQQDPLAYIEILSEPNRIVEQGIQCARTAQQSISVFFTMPSLLSYEEGLALVREPLQRGIEYRTLYETHAWEEANSRDFIRQCREWGQQIRFIPSLPLKMQIFDQRTTLLSLQAPLIGTPSFTALNISHPGLAQMLHIAFESFWQQGTEDVE